MGSITLFVLVVSPRQYEKRQYRTDGGIAYFYFHELYEADLMDNAGLDYHVAHRKALDHYNVADFTIYHPDVVREFSANFGRLWSEFWEKIGGQ